MTKRFLGQLAGSVLFGFLLCLAVPSVPADPPAPQPVPAHKHKTGARRTPQHKIAKAIAAGTLKVHRAVTTTPPQYAYVPKQLSMWLNDQDGDCVSAEEAFQVGAYSGAATGTEYFIQDATVLAFCNQFNVLNGADLLSVIQDMEQTGMTQGSDTIQDGTSSVVDYSTESILQNAISQGPVKIGIDSSALPSGAGNGNGWYAFGGTPQQFTNEDHCVDVCGYGPVPWLAQQLGVPTPPGAPANGYLLYTWDSIGIVDEAWIMSTTGEAYLRGALVINGKALPPISPTPVPPTPVPPTPVPPGPTPAPGPLYSMSTDASGVITFSPTGSSGSVVLTAEQVAQIQAILAGQAKPTPKPPAPPSPPAPPKTDGGVKPPAPPPTPKPQTDARGLRDYQWRASNTGWWLCDETLGCRVGHYWTADRTYEPLLDVGTRFERWGKVCAPPIALPDMQQARR